MQKNGLTDEQKKVLIENWKLDHAERRAAMRAMVRLADDKIDLLFAELRNSIPTAVLKMNSLEFMTKYNGSIEEYKNSFKTVEIKHTQKPKQTADRAVRSTQKENNNETGKIKTHASKKETITNAKGQKKVIPFTPGKSNSKTTITETPKATGTMLNFSEPPNSVARAMRPNETLHSSNGSPLIIETPSKSLDLSPGGLDLLLPMTINVDGNAKVIYFNPGDFKGHENEREISDYIKRIKRIF